MSALGLGGPVMKVAQVMSGGAGGAREGTNTREDAVEPVQHMLLDRHRDPDPVLCRRVVEGRSWRERELFTPDLGGRRPCRRVLVRASCWW